MTPVTPDERAAIVDAIKAGTPRNEIARISGRSKGTITNIAHAEGLAFDRSATKSVCAALQVDNAARRARLASGLLDDAERLRSQLFEPTMTFNIGGKENTYTEHEIPQPTFADKRNLLAAVRLAATTAMDLEKVDKGDEYDGPRGLLEEPIDGLRQQAVDADG